MTWETSNRKQRLPSNWAFIRRRVLERDGYKCQICGMQATEVDHIVPGDNHRRSNLRAICTNCHSKKSSQEGVEARLKQRSLRKRPVENHPGLRKSS